MSNKFSLIQGRGRNNIFTHSFKYFFKEADPLDTEKQVQAKMNLLIESPDFKDAVIGYVQRCYKNPIDVIRYIPVPSSYYIDIAFCLKQNSIMHVQV